MTTNPFTPPNSNIDVIDISSKQPIYVVVVLATIQTLCFALNILFQFELVRFGAMPPLGPLVAVVSSVLLVIGAFLFAAMRKGRRIFLVSSIGFLVATVQVWNVPLSPLVKHSTYTLGVLVGLFSSWVVHRWQIESMKSQAIPAINQ